MNTAGIKTLDYLQSGMEASLTKGKTQNNIKKQRKSRVQEHFLWPVDALGLPPENYRPF